MVEVLHFVAVRYIPTFVPWCFPAFCHSQDVLLVMFIYACMHTYIHIYVHTCIHAYMHACMHTYIHTYTQYIVFHTSHPMNLQSHPIPSHHKSIQERAIPSAPGPVGQQTVELKVASDVEMSWCFGMLWKNDFVVPLIMGFWEIYSKPLFLNGENPWLSGEDFPIQWFEVFNKRRLIHWQLQKGSSLCHGNVGHQTTGFCWFLLVSVSTLLLSVQNIRSLSCSWSNMDQPIYPMVKSRIPRLSHPDAGHERCIATSLRGDGFQGHPKSLGKADLLSGQTPWVMLIDELFKSIYHKAKDHTGHPTWRPTL